MPGHGEGLPQAAWSLCRLRPAHTRCGGKSRAGSLSFTEGPIVRKNLEPFWLNGMMLYTYGAPGQEGGKTTYPGDILDTRVGLEYVVDDKRGFGLILDGVYQQGLPYRLDGHAINTEFKTFALIGLASAGVLFTLAGQNNVDAIYPGFSVKYFWGEP
jgi:hypothetical protein